MGAIQQTREDDLVIVCSLDVILDRNTHKTYFKPRPQNTSELNAQILEEVKQALKKQCGAQLLT